MNILFLLSGLNRGGAEHQLLILTRELIRRGHRVTVSVAYAGDHYEEAFRSAGADIVHLNQGDRPKRDQKLTVVIRGIARLVALIRLLRREDYDLIHSYGRTPSVYAATAARLTRSKFVLGVRGSARIRHPLLRILQWYAASTADLIISNSEAGRSAAIEDGFPAGRIRVIENGIDTRRFRINAAWRREIREEFSIGTDNLLIGIVGRLNPVKNHELFLEAAKLLMEPYPHAKFLIVGHDEPPRLSQLTSRARDLGVDDRVIWAGPRDDLERVYNGLDALILCSRTEGFPNVVAEAMASGVPCVATKAGDAEKIIGELGEIVDIRTPLALSQGVSQMLERRANIDGAEIRSRIVNLWSIDSLADRSESAFRRACQD